MDRRVGCSLVSAASIWLPTLAMGQSPDPGRDPELNDESLIEVRDNLVDGTGMPGPGIDRAREGRSDPVRPHQPLALNEPGRLLPEGSFLVEQPALLARSAAGVWIVSAQGPAGLKPMIAIPSQTLSGLETLLDESGRSEALTVSGRVTLYAGQNYLLISAVGQPPASAQPEPTGRHEPATDERGLSEAAAELLKELDEARTGIRGVIAAQGDAPGRAPVPEGRVISRRSARLVRLDAGELAIAFDDDGQIPGAIDPTLIVAPCSLLEEIEALAERYGEGLIVTVSGSTLAYGSRSSILPTSLVIQRPGEIGSRQ